MKRTPLAKQSKKRKLESQIYADRRKLFLAQRPICEWPLCFNRSTDIHHVMGRGKRLLNTVYWRAMCRKCHRWLTDNGRLARKLEWIIDPK